MTANAMIIDKRDNVAVMLKAAADGEWIECGANGLTARGMVPVYHKIALTGIKAGQPVVKYGERIGVATEDIPAGAHVHTHNVRSESLAARGEGAQ